MLKKKPPYDRRAVELQYLNSKIGIEKRRDDYLRAAISIFEEEKYNANLHGGLCKQLRCYSTNLLRHYPEIYLYRKTTKFWWKEQDKQSRITACLLAASICDYQLKKFKRKK